MGGIKGSTVGEMTASGKKKKNVNNLHLLY